MRNRQSLVQQLWNGLSLPLTDQFWLPSRNHSCSIHILVVLQPFPPHHLSTLKHAGKDIGSLLKPTVGRSSLKHTDFEELCWNSKSLLNSCALIPGWCAMCALQETLKISQVLIVLLDVHIVHPGARPASWPRVCVEHPASWNYLPLSWPWMAWLVAFLPTPRGHLTWIPMKTGKLKLHTLLTQTQCKEANKPNTVKHHTLSTIYLSPWL